jgi:ketosteroid isomerase-like protein
MSGEEVLDLVHRLDEGDQSALDRFQPLLAILDPDVEWDVRAIGVADLTVMHGPAGVIRFWTRWLSEWSAYSWEAEDFEELGDHVIYDASIQGTSRGAGVPVQMDQTHLMSFRAGKLVRFSIHRTRAEALAVARTA